MSRSYFELAGDLQTEHYRALGVRVRTGTASGMGVVQPQFTGGKN